MSLEDSIREAVRAVLLEELPRALAGVTSSTSSSHHVYLSPGTAAELAEVHPDTIRAWVRAGKLTEHRAGRELRVRRDDLERFLATVPERRDSPEDEAERILARKRK